MRPSNISGLNQIYARDIAFVIDSKLCIPNIIEDRSEELQALESLIESFDQDSIVKMPESARIEGGDVLLVDGLINFSREFLPDRRGSRTMDVSLVLTSHLYLDQIDDEHVEINFAAAETRNAELFANGGRVLSVVSVAKSFHKARKHAYKAIEKISLSGSHYRTDIAQKVDEGDDD